LFLLFLLYIREPVVADFAVVKHGDEHEAKVNKIEQADVNRVMTAHSKKHLMNMTEMQLMKQRGLSDVEKMKPL
jgi:hypothetical protein